MAVFNQAGGIAAGALRLPALKFLHEQLARSRTTATVVTLLLGIALWELVGRITSDLFFAPASATMIALVDAVLERRLLTHARVTLTEIAVGFFLGAAIGVAGGALAAGNRHFRTMSDPWVSILYTTPYVAIAPLLIVWFGLGIESKIALVTFAVFVPVWLNTYMALTTVNKELLEVLHSFDAAKLQIVRWLIIPWALPPFIMGLRIAFARGFTAAIVGEFLGSTSGLGNFTSRASESFQTATLFAGIFVLIVFGVLSVEGLKWVQHKVVPWWEERD